jgi:hypothetical protein
MIMQGPAKIATYLGIGMALLGFGLIGLAWNGAAELDFIQGQLPYALSGGLGGLGLIIGGMAVLGVQTQRTITALRAREMARLQDEADALLRTLIRPAPGEVIEDETVIDVGNRTVIRTIDRRPASEAELAAGEVAEPGGRPAGGYAPRPRRAPATEAVGVDDEAATAVTLMDRSDTSEAEQPDEQAWAPPSGSPGVTEEVDDLDAFAVVLDEVSGIGPAKQARIAEHFGTVAALRQAAVDDIAAVPGISPTLASRIARSVR